jgi:ankyrin repeat protein
LLQRGALPGLSDYHGSTPLHFASYYGHGDVATPLLHAGANPNIQNVYGETPARQAARKGHLTTLQILVENGADMYLEDVNGEVTIHAAARKGNLDVVQFLLARGGRVQALSNTGSCVLHAALLASIDAMDNWVIDHVTAYHQRSRENGTVLDMLCRSNLIAAIEKMFWGPRAADARLAINDFSDSVPPALVSAAAAGHSDVIEILLKHGANIEICWRHVGTALMAACSHGRLRAVQMLVSRGAQLSCWGLDGSSFNAIDQAKHHPDVVKWLSETLSDRVYPNPADVNQETTIDQDESSHQASVKFLRRRNSCFLIHERWAEVAFGNSHREGKLHFDDKQWRPSTNVAGQKDTASQSAYPEHLTREPRVPHRAMRG